MEKSKPAKGITEGEYDEDDDSMYLFRCLNKHGKKKKLFTFHLVFFRSFSSKPRRDLQLRKELAASRLIETFHPRAPNIFFQFSRNAAL